MSTEPTSSLAGIYVGLFLLQWIFNLGIAAWMYFKNADTNNASATESIGRKLDEFISAQKERMATLEARIAHVPDHEEISSLREDVAETRQRAVGIEELVKRLEHQQNLIYQHLLQK